MTETRKILLVEDDPKDVELTLAAVREIEAARDVVVITNGDEALDYLYRRGKFGNRAEGLPALILLDIKLPLVSGLEVLRSIKSDDALQPVPVVMLTSSREQSDVDESYRLGANAYVVKPLDFPEYVTSVKDLCLFWAGLNQPPSICTS